MKYMILMYNSEAAAQNYTPSKEEFQAAAKEWYAVGEAMKAAGVLIGNHGLAPSTDATTVRVRENKTVTSDGPFAETHEQLAGYYLLDCKDLDEAIHWAAKIPTASYGSVEIRPLNQWSQ